MPRRHPQKRFRIDVLNLEMIRRGRLQTEDRNHTQAMTSRTIQQSQWKPVRTSPKRNTTSSKGNVWQTPRSPLHLASESNSRVRKGKSHGGGERLSSRKGQSANAIHPRGVRRTKSYQPDTRYQVFLQKILVDEFNKKEHGNLATNYRGLWWLAMASLTLCRALSKRLQN